MITLQIGKPINIALPYVYKYMDEQFIDMFFDKGILRISSFKKFIEFPDEIRGDKSEGQGAFNTKGGDGFQFLLMSSAPSDAYMFCTSLIASENLRKEFDVSSYFKIKKPLDFSAAITNAILGSNQAFLGFCNYQGNRIIKKQIEDMSVKDFTNEEGNLIIGGSKMNQRMNEIFGSGIDLMFLKEDNYQRQAEFRFVWTVNKQFYEMQEHLDIQCKEAIQFCERVTVDDL